MADELRASHSAMVDQLGAHEASHRELEALKGVFDGRLSSFESAISKVVSDIHQLKSNTAEQVAAIKDEVLAHVSSVRASIDENRANMQSILNIRPNVHELTEKFSKLNQPALFLSSTKNGLMVLKSGDLISQYIINDGVWDEHIVKVMNDVSAKRSGVAIDVGAHFGTLTLAMARRFSQVISFEPNDFSFRILEANVNLNGLSNVSCRNHPLFSSKIDMSLANESLQELALPEDDRKDFDPVKATNLGAYTFSAGGTGTFKHQAMRIDDLNLPAVDFIKIDVQGADGEVLLGALETIERCRPFIAFEWETMLAANFGVSFERVQAELERRKYSLQMIKRHNEKQFDYLAVPNSRL